MLITRVKVSSLYGIHNYDISFDKEECVKIIHAPNGFGKTTILKLVKAIIDLQITEIKRVPFEAFMIYFENEIVLNVMKKGELLSYELHKGQEVLTYLVDSQREESHEKEVLAFLDMVRQKMPIYFIDANRLWLARNDYDESGKVLLPTVLEYAEELSEWMREALAQSNFCGQDLDRSFPSRLIALLDQKDEIKCDIETIKDELEALEKKRIVLEGAGLFSPASNTFNEQLDHLDENMLKVLYLYIQDSKEKLKVFEHLATKINLLCELINKRFTYKVMEVNMKDGFVFKVPTHEKLKADKLSSGEQNELILMFMLLFKAPRHALILLDEPEISLHIAWQQSFLEDMQAISSLSDIRIMIATHSPDIINGRWDLTTGLEEEE